MKLKIAIVALFAVVAGCENTDGSVGQPGSPLWLRTATAEQQATYFGGICSSYGFVPGTPQMSQCIAEETRTTRQAARDRMAGIAAANRTVTCQTYGSTTTCR